MLYAETNVILYVSYTEKNVKVRFPDGKKKSCLGNLKPLTKFSKVKYKKYCNGFRSLIQLLFLNTFSKY